MFNNYFKIAFRNLRRNKVFSFINIFGLAVGFTCCMLIAAFLYSELSYDKFPVHAKDIYRVELNLENKDFYSSVDIGVGEGMKTNYPEIQSITKLWSERNVFIKHDDVEFKEPAVAIVDANFFNFFSMPFLYGHAATALKEPNTVVLSRDYAIKYFGTENAVGKTLLINGNASNPYKVTGVIGKLPGELHFNFGIYSYLGPVQRQTWSNLGVNTYLRLQPGTDPKQLEAKFPQLVAKYVVPEVQHDMGVSLAEAQKSINSFVFTLKPLSKIHLYSANKDELGTNGSIKYIYIFSALALFILLLACVNFTNLSTAISIKRSKEVGIRKVMGSAKKQLVSQFLTESMTLAMIAFIFAIGLVFLLLPYFNQLAGKEISFAFFMGYKTLLVELASVISVGIFAGIYPALFLSSFNIVNILKGKGVSKPGTSHTLRSGLVVFQFAVSITIIISTIVLFQQLHFMQHKDPGFDKEQVLVINDTYLLQQNQAAFKQDLLQDSRVISVTNSSDIPVGLNGHDGTQAFAKRNLEKEDHGEIHIDKFHIDYDYIKTLGMQVVKGRAFSKAFSTDSAAVILNETAVKEFGFADIDPIGQTIIMSGQQHYSVVGVVKDFHYTSVKEKIIPMVMMLRGSGGAFMAKVKTTAVTDLINKAKSKWNSYDAGGTFSYSFLDERFATVYASEEKTGKIFTLFAALSIIIAALGLFGLSAFTIQQRTKEIGVRKVLGASIPNVVLLLSKEFLIMVGIALLIATPVTWFAIHKWLEEFAYRIDVSWVTFLIAGVLALLVGLLTVSFQAVKAAIANPINSLRTE
ncbi:MAG: ABC transporter permease [Ferruginibacter sp.]